MNENLV